MNFRPPIESPTCPPEGDLHRFWNAALPAPEMDAVEVHLRQCPTCMARYEACDEDSDTLIQALASLPGGPDDEPGFCELQQTLLAQAESCGLGDLPTLTFAGGSPRAESYNPTQLASYELIELIGQGATGTVYRARHRNLDRIVAVKVLNAHYVGRDAEALQRFQQEMRAVGRLDHPHIVRATDAGEDRGRHYLVMEYVEGIDLSRLLRLAGPLRVADACELVRQAALALAFAHEHQLVHRDVKPSNLLLTRDGTLKLLDLGLVGSFGDHDPPAVKEPPSFPHGTADYMSPEQWTHFESVDARADIYSLGCTLYKLLTGRPVFPAARHDYAAKMRAHQSTVPTPVRSHRPEVPLGLQKILGRMLAKNPSERYQSAGDVAEHLSAYVDGARLASIAARLDGVSRAALQSLAEESTVTALRRPARVHRRWLLLAAASAVPVAAWWWRGQAPAARRLRTGNWRPLQVAATPESFPALPQSDSVLSAAAAKTVETDSCVLESHAPTLWELGSPVTGRFALRTDFACQTESERVGLFFKYRPFKTREGRAYPFQVIEFARPSPEASRLFWSRYCFYERSDGGYREEYKPWAELPVALPAGLPEATLEVRLGLVGFPEVVWNGQLIKASEWDQTWESRQMSQLTRDELARAYLGRLGIFLRGAGRVLPHGTRVSGLKGRTSDGIHSKAHLSSSLWFHDCGTLGRDRDHWSPRLLALSGTQFGA